MKFFRFKIFALLVIGILVGFLVFFTVCSPKYDKLLPFGSSLFKDGVARIQKNNKVGLIDKNYKQTVLLEFDMIYTFYNHKAVAKKNSKFGLIDTKGNTLIPFIYDNLVYLGDLCVATKNKKQGLISLKNEILLDFKYDKIQRLGKTHLKLISKDKVGLASLDGKLILMPVLDDITEFGNTNFFKIKRKNKYYLAKKSNGHIISFGYKHLWYLKGENLSKYSNDGKLWGLLDENAKELSPAMYSQIDSFYHVGNTDLYISQVKKDGKYGLIGVNGQKIAKAIYDNIQNIYFHNFGYFFILRKGKKAILINEKGKKGKKFSNFEKLKDFNTRLALMAIKTNGKYKVFDTNANQVLKREFEDFKNNYTKNKKALIKENGTWKLIDIKKDKDIISLDFDDVRMGDKYIFVSKNKKWGLVDFSGKLIIEPTYNSFYLNDKILYARKNSKAGLIDLKENIILPFKYDGITILSKDYAMIKKDKIWQHINLNTKKITENIKFESYKILSSSPNIFGYSLSKEKPSYIEIFNENLGTAIINIKGKIIVPFGTFTPTKLKNAFLVYDFKRAKIGFYGLDGKLIEPIIYDSNISSYGWFYNDGVYLIKNVNKWYLKDIKTGKIILESK